MGSLPPPVKLSLDVRPTFVPNTIGGFLREVAAIDDVSRRSSRLEDLVSNLEEELRKIDAFKRELPLCMLLMQDAIITLKLELVQCKTARSDYQPMQLAELMPLKKGSDEVEIERHDEDDKEKDAKDKKNWKSCLQLWNSSTSFNNDSPTGARSFDLKEDRQAESTKGNDELEKNQETASEKDDVLRKNGNRVSEFIPIFPRKEMEEGLELPLSLLTSSGGSKKSCSSSMEKTEKRPSSSSSIRRPISLNFQPSSRNNGDQQQNSRKLRRCWSPELHRRFISALQQLGGSQVATPKQIRELMQVDGLTNDEVKSHLQKYRLHTRRYPVASAANETKNQLNQSQFVLRGLWPSSSQDKTDESAKANNNNNNDLSGSPEGPLQLCLSAGAAASATGGGDSNSMEDDEDSKSRSFTWGKNHIHRPSTIGV